MMRRLVQRHRGILPLDTVESIWRVIISTFTHSAGSSPCMRICLLANPRCGLGAFQFRIYRSIHSTLQCGGCG